MRVIKISERLYRVYDNGTYKDVRVENGEIQYPENPHNLLRPTEEQAIEMILF
jgi:hypothetical protein